MTKRLDILLTERGLCPTQQKAESIIRAGWVWNNQIRLDKPGLNVDENLDLEIRCPKSRFVSRAGDKLQAALDAFQVSIQDRVCLDLGASTGGFTDCLLQNGASFVHCVDVGYGLLDISLRDSPKTQVLERTNARYLTPAQLTEQLAPVSLATLDLSFISIKSIVPHIRSSFPCIEDWLILFKPQFEVERSKVLKGGIVRDEDAIEQSLFSVNLQLEQLGLNRASSPKRSPIPGKKSGNVELLLHYTTAAPHDYGSLT